MPEIIEMKSEDAQPTRDEILENLGIPAGQELSENVEELIHEATNLFQSICRPRGIIAGIPVSDFAGIYSGEGLNAKKTPLGDMYGQACDIALFALTIGMDVTEMISELFLKDQLALAGVLDATASAGAETAADRVEIYYYHKILTSEVKHEKPNIYRFAPGYCGWHITGQKKLFRFLEPEKIGITLMPSYMMSPLKSLSGAIVVTDESTNAFGDAYEVCMQCGTHWCRTRKQVLKEHGV
jgi:hypothetical protein